MAIAPPLRRAIESGQLDLVEEAWLDLAANDPPDLDALVGIARALVGAGQEELARLLLGLLDEQLQERDSWVSRLALLQRAPELPLDPTEVHPQLLETLGRIYPGSDLLEALVEKVGLHRAIEDLPKSVLKVERLVDLMQFDVGSIVRMKGKGVGRVTEVNFELDSFRVDFERNPGLAVGFRAAAKLLEPLAPEHFLRRKLEEPEALRSLVGGDPPAVLEAILTSWNRPMTAAEIRLAAAGVVDEERWTSWWNVARRHPQVITHGKGRQTYSWADSSEDAADSSWLSFQRAGTGEKLAIFRRTAGKEGAGAERMAAALAGQADEIAAEDPVGALVLWQALDRSGDAAATSVDPRRIVAAASQPAELATAVEDRALRDRVCEWIREVRSDWPAVFHTLVGREDDPRILDRLTAELARHQPTLFERAMNEILSRPRQHAGAFVWFAERAAEDEALRQRRPLVLLQHLLVASSWQEMAPYRQRLKTLLHSGGTVARTLLLLGEDEAARAEEAIRRAGALEEYEREPLINSLHLRFPTLRRADEILLYALPESIEARRSELRKLLEKEIPANRKAIEEARAMGDLRENFEYKSARQRHEYLSSRVATLERDLGRARPLDLASVGSERVRIGCRIRFAGDSGRHLTILGPWESSPENHIVSYESDLGKSMLGLEVGDRAEVEGVELEIAAIEPALQRRHD